MREFTIDKKNAGKRLDRWLSTELPALPLGLMQKFIRLKRIKLNGKGAQRDQRLNEGDVLQLYIEDEFFIKPKLEDPFLSKIKPRLDILYEDENLLLVDKRPGLMCHPDATEKVNTLITHAQAYLYQKGEYDSREPGAFAPALCNRIDRFTGGIVIIAKTEEAMHILNNKIRDREIEKRYLCIVHGRMHPANGMLDNYISKSDSAKRVTVLDRSVPGAQRAQTRYQTMETRNSLSLMECELLTGRTHQIRAQFAHAKHPLLGDNQYGSAKQNEKFNRSFQALYAYKLVFRFTTDAGILAPLNGKSWQVKSVPFVAEFFANNPDNGREPADARNTENPRSTPNPRNQANNHENSGFRNPGNNRDGGNPRNQGNSRENGNFRDNGNFRNRENPRNASNPRNQANSHDSGNPHNQSSFRDNGSFRDGGNFRNRPKSR